ncbi:MAG: hypothetical protein ACKO16_15920 [Gemmataceae bacterium]
MSAKKKWFPAFAGMTEVGGWAEEACFCHPCESGGPHPCYSVASGFLDHFHANDSMEGPMLPIIGLYQSGQYLFEWIQSEPGGF